MGIPNPLYTSLDRVSFGIGNGGARGGKLARIMLLRETLFVCGLWIFGVLKIDFRIFFEGEACSGSAICNAKVVVWH